MRYKFKTLLFAAGFSLLALACQREDIREENAAEQQLPLSLEALGVTRTDVSGTTGKVSWTPGDAIGVYISSPERGNAYWRIPVDTDNQRVSLPLDPGEVRCGYAVYPYSASQIDDPDPEGDSPRILYPASYELDSHDPETYVPVPMMALNRDEDAALDFFHTGGLIRIDLHALPAGTSAITVEFVGMDHVCGICAVSHPGTAKSTTALVTGYGNVITFTGVSAATTHLNIPVPNLDFSGLTLLKLSTYADLSAEPTDKFTKSVLNSWGRFKHAFGRLVPVDFGSDGVLTSLRLSATSDITLWRSQTLQRTAKAYYDDGTVYPDIEITWESSDPDIVTVDPSNGFVTAVAPGSAVITATATPEVGSPVSASYNVYANAISGISLASDEDFVEWYGGTMPLTATLTHTEYGNIISYPEDMVNWSSSAPDYVQLTDSSRRPFRRDDTHGAVTGIVAGAEKGGASSIISATVNSKYVVSAASSSATKSILCKQVTKISTTVPTVRGRIFSPSYLMQPAVGLWAFSDDVLDIWNHLPLNGAEPFAYPRYYFTWTELANYFDGETGDDITHSLNTFVNGDGTWEIPSRNDLEALLDATDTEQGSTICVDGGPLEGRKHFATVTLDMTGHSYGTDGFSYGQGALFFPDDATVYCKGLLQPDKVNTSLGYYYNTISYDDLMTLIDGGCVFFPVTGNAGVSSFYKWEGQIRSWAATKNGINADLLQISTWQHTVGTASINNYVSCRLIKKTNP
jgi:hypothetical protein